MPAERVREQVFSAFEEAERAPDAATREPYLTFVVVGGGPTGVEIAGQLAVLARHHMQGDFDRIDPARTRVVLLAPASACSRIPRRRAGPPRDGRHGLGLGGVRQPAEPGDAT